MGKKGAELRAAKAQKLITMTRAELEAHDHLLLESRRKEIMKDCTARLDEEMKKRKEEIDREIEKEWAARTELLNSGEQGAFENMVGYLIALPARVLIEKFGWKPLRKDGKYKQNMKIDKFCKYILDDLNDIMADEMKDIRKYADEVYQKYGIKIEAVEE